MRDRREIGAGIVPALRLAGRRALAALPRVPDVVLLDGSHNWLRPAVIDLARVEHGVGAPSDDEVLFDLPQLAPATGARQDVVREPAPEVDLVAEPG